MLWIYVPIFISLVLVSGLASKNFTRRTVHNTGYIDCFLFLLVSVLASTLPFILMQQSVTAWGLLQLSLVFAVSTIATIMAIVEVAVLGQRISLRESALLEGHFFRKQKRLWETKLKGFNNGKKIVSYLDEGEQIATFFERGYFSMVILWSCNIMEKILDAVGEEILSRSRSKKELYRKDDNSRLGYPQQLKNLGFKAKVENCRKTEQISVEALWHEIRNDVAHRNYKPTFQQTYGAMCILVSFLKDMPTILETQIVT